jgi:lysophospholipase L1-like esterase
MKLVLKDCCLLSLLFFLSLSVAAQTVAYDSSYQSTYYEQKVTLFRLLPDEPNEIIFLGNSITDIGEWTEIWHNIKVKNRGISGDNTFGVLARLDEIVSAKPKQIFIMIGINDIARNIPDSIILSNYSKIIQTIQQTSPTTTIIVQSILPTNNEFTAFKNHQNKTVHIVAVNQALQKMCSEKGLTFLNLHDAFLDENGKLNKQYTNDGLHINGYGYMLWKKIIQEKGLL